MYQHGSDVFYAVCKNIELKQELKVWYAQHYAERIGIDVHSMTEQDREEREMEECKWPCYECGGRFRTSALLEKHMTQHDDLITTGNDSDNDQWSRNKQQPTIKKKRGRPCKMLVEMGEGKFLSWKKRTTNLYLNKTLKKYQQRRQTSSEAIRRTMKSLYRRRGKGVFNSWVCLHCGLTFNNSSLLNLHTLTHAAEDVGMGEGIIGDIMSQAKLGDLGFTDATDANVGRNIFEPITTPLCCPTCFKVFDEKQDLIEHASEHALVVPEQKPNMCPVCYKNFTTPERLQRHMTSHGDDKDKPFPCAQCDKRFTTNAALMCHKRTHSHTASFTCLICGKGFTRGKITQEHVKMHEVNGFYSCPRCSRRFSNYKKLKKHMHNYHGNTVYNCSECEKTFCVPEKLKVHMLKHSDKREFMCDTCGKQFKRKDKLQEHVKRMHSREKEVKMFVVPQTKAVRRFTPKVSPNDHHRFIYKCHDCLVGFKRRGMLINHLIKRHPNISLDTIPELNMPILKEQKDFYCQYCDKIYKSTSKRKIHILKKHPGASLPHSNKEQIVEIPGLPNPTYSTTTGSTTSQPHNCTFCSKQYASRPKMLQHQRDKHPELMFLQPPRRNKSASKDVPLEENYQESDTNLLTHVDPMEALERSVHVTINTSGDLSQSDLLTQAMSELTQTFGEEGAARILNAQNLVATSAANNVELSSLNNALLPGYTTIQTLGNVPMEELKQTDEEVGEITKTIVVDSSSIQPSDNGTGYTINTQPSDNGTGYTINTQPSDNGTGYTINTQPSDNGTGYTINTNIPIVIAPNSFLQKNNDWQSYVYRP